MLGRKIKTFFIQICQAVWAISYSLLYVVSKINQGSCLGCLGGDDAPAYDIKFFRCPNLDMFGYFHCTSLTFGGIPDDSHSDENLGQFL